MLRVIENRTLDLRECEELARPNQDVRLLKLIAAYRAAVREGAVARRHATTMLLAHDDLKRETARRSAVRLCPSRN